MNSAEDILDAAARLGLARIVPDLRTGVSPSLRFDVERAEDLPVAVTRIGGAPAMPAELGWPAWRDLP